MSRNGQEFKKEIEIEVVDGKKKIAEKILRKKDGKIVENKVIIKDGNGHVLKVINKDK